MFGFDCLKGTSNFTHFTADTGRTHQCLPGSAHNERPRKDIGQVFPARRRQSAVNSSKSGGGLSQFPDRNGFAGQERFIEQQIVRRNESCIRRYPVALGNHDDVVANNVPAGNMKSLAVANHEGTWTREISKRFQYAFAAGFLHDGDRNREGGEQKQEQGFDAVAQQ